MPKKLKSLAEDSSQSELASTIQHSANNIWLAGLGAFAKAQQEGSRVFDALIKEGEQVQGRIREAADERITELNTTATGTWERLEKVFEDRVERALGSIGVPTEKDVKQLTEKVEDLTAMVERLSKSMEEKPTRKTTRKTATRKTAKR